jgi:hypothetical protein
MDDSRELIPDPCLELRIFIERFLGYFENWGCTLRLVLLVGLGGLVWLVKLFNFFSFVPKAPENRTDAEAGYKS